MSHVARIKAALSAGQPLAPEDAATVLRALEVGDVNAALGLNPRDQRDAILRSALARFFPGMSLRARAEECAKLWQRYAAIPWIRERYLDECPQHRLGKLEGAFWRALKLVPHPLSGERLRRL